MDAFGYHHVLEAPPRELINMVDDRHLVALKPTLYSKFECPNCRIMGCEPIESYFPGIHVLGRYRCASCHTGFLRDLPVGFAVEHPLAVDTGTGRLFNTTNAYTWLTAQFLQGYREPCRETVRIERLVRRQCRHVVLLNTLDFLYGHVLLKLYNAQYYLDHHPEMGLVLIVPKALAWLVPRAVAEVWVVDQPLSRAQRWYRSIDAFVQRQLQRFDAVFIAKAYPHPDFSSVDIERFAGVAPFPPTEFLKRPPHITFVARTDRLWFLTRRGKFCYRALNRLWLGDGASRWFVRRQESGMRRTIKCIRRILPEATFTVVGLGRAGALKDLAHDLRFESMDERTERAWCTAYAASQVVVGMHGSNMLLPTALAAGCVEILPYDRYGNLVQDISVRYLDRRQLFHYRFVDEFARPRDIARHVCSMFKHQFAFYRNNLEHTF